MSRMPRIHIENTLYYITSRGDHNENIFMDDADYAAYLELLKKSKEEYGFKLFAFCLLPNHLHLLLELAGQATISQIMHSLNSNYIKYFNAKYQKKGHLFQERYKLILAEKEAYLMALSAYIHLNPRALALATDAPEYKYSSLPIYIGKTANSSGIELRDEIKEITKFLKGKRYEDYMSLANSDMERIGKELAKNPILGSDEFINKIKAKVEDEKVKMTQQAQPLTKSPVFKKLIFGGTVAVAVMAALTVYLYGRSVEMKKKFAADMTSKEKELDTKITQERTRIRQDLDDKYRADMVSYEAMIKRLESEKNRMEEPKPKVTTQKGR